MKKILALTFALVLCLGMFVACGINGDKAAENLKDEGYEVEEITDATALESMAAMLKAVNAGKKALVVLDSVDAVVIKSFANIPGVKTVQANQLSVYDILNCNTFIMTEAAAKKVEEVYGE